jgi:hypothetical protein
VRQDYRWLEENLARLVPVELVIRFDEQIQKRDNKQAHVQARTDAVNRARYTFLQRAKTVAQIQTAIDRELGASGEDTIGRPMSAVTFMPNLPKSSKRLGGVVRNEIFDTRLEQSFARFADAGYLAKDVDESELWRISVRVAAFEDVDYADFTGRLKKVVSPLVQRHNNNFVSRSGKTPDTSDGDQIRPNISVVYTGVIPIVYKAQRALLESLMQSAFWSFITITPLLILVSRGIGRGLVAMIPNSLPVLVVFGGMGWLDIPVTIGSMMSASIALGVAVDDTIHYLVWFREELKTNPDRHQASLEAYRTCATPTLQAALISGLGLAVFGLSNFTATRQFGLLMSTILIAGVIAELIMLPALLAGPMGKVFEQKRARTSRDSFDLTPTTKHTSKVA